MKLEELELGFWQEQKDSVSLCSSSKKTMRSMNVISFKSLKPLASKLESFNSIASLNCHNVHMSTKTRSNAHFQAVSQLGGTRWNPTHEQIRRLEVLYQGGLRTPNSQQIEKITAELRKYGRIEGKNVFYWFQNHKARERQRQKRSALLALRCSPSLMSFAPTATQGEKRMEAYEACCKRQCRSWGAMSLDLEEKHSDGTLELFPLHPEGGKCCK